MIRITMRQSIISSESGTIRKSTTNQELLIARTLIQAGRCRPNYFRLSRTSIEILPSELMSEWHSPESPHWSITHRSRLSVHFAYRASKTEAVATKYSLRLSVPGLIHGELRGSPIASGNCSHDFGSVSPMNHA